MVFYLRIVLFQKIKNCYEDFMYPIDILKKVCIETIC